MDTAILDETSLQFLGQWQRLVSTTNWDKGRIICQWRAALEESGAPASEISDEAWSRRAGQVSPQHVGRLRRVYERFGQQHSQYAHLYWSHFQAALDWNDAEMWLEGAVQNDWSIADMRRQRWEAHGAPDELKPSDEDVISSEWDQDVAEQLTPAPAATAEVGRVRAPRDTSDSDEEEDGDAEEFDDAAPAYEAATNAAPPVRPFAELPSLPADVTDAFEVYKLCILRHKLSGWQEISCDDMVASLDALKELAFAAPGA
jgi:hypothetical protein